MARTDTLNLNRRKLLRKTVSGGENKITLFLIFTMLCIGTWFVFQRDNYDPGQRDLPVELLTRSSSPKLYDTPIKSWIDPSQTIIGSSTQFNLQPFPESIVALNWRATGRVKTFDKDNLFEKINGEAEKFIKLGFQSLSYLVIQGSNGTDELSIELYDHGDISGSMGIFATHLSSKRTIQQTDKTIYFITSAGLIGRKGKYFFRVAGNSGSEQIQQKSAQLIQVFSELPDNQSETPRAITIFAKTFNVPEKLINHQRNNVFQFDFAQDFWFGQLEENAPARIFLHFDSSATTNTTMYEQIVEEQSYEYKVVEKTPQHIVMWHEFLKSYFVIGHHNHAIYGLENVPQKPKMIELLTKLKEAMAGG